ncbi:MAG: hypothetical protein ACRDKD_04940 [Solirubrobacteraceae bacterium]
MARVTIDGVKEEKEPLVATIAPDTEKLRELDEDERRAWNEYYDNIQDLTGEEYERVELESWDTLQGELRRIERRRRLLNVANS